MIDTHAHLTSKQFDRDRDQTIARAFEAGLSYVVEIGMTPESSQAALTLAGGHDRMRATVGIHPHEAGRHSPEDVSRLEPLLAGGQPVAVGETGLDFYRDYAPRDRQEDLFRRQIELALRFRLPLVVHSRGAEERVLEILDETGASAVGGVLHCYGGPAELIERGCALGFHFGFGGSVSRSKGKYRKMLPEVPLDRLVFETDCPYLAPAPKTSRRNEPAFVREVLPVAASFLGMSEDELESATDRNARRLFDLPVTTVP